MRLTKIEIVHFGKLNNVSFDLKDNLDVFQGANEAGKSTTVAFIKQVIFGFYLRNSKTAPFFEDYSPLARVSPMGGKLTFEDGKDKYVLERLYVKGDPKKGVLTVSLNGKQAPNETFFKKIQNIGPKFYTDSFIFNQDTLREVTALTQDQLMERIYFLGAAESSRLLDLRDDFEKQASELFKKTGRKPIINDLLTKIKQQETKVSQTSQEFNQYYQLEQNLKQLTVKRDEEQASLKKIQAKVQKYQTLKQQLVNYQEFQTLKSQVKDVKFSTSDFEKAQSLSFEIKSLQSSLTKLEQQASEISKNLSDFPGNLQDLLDQKAQILQWQTELKQFDQKVAQLNQEISQLNKYQPEAFKLLKMTDQERKQLKQDYEDLSKQDEQGTSSKSVLNIVGIVLVVIGLILTFALTPFSILISLIGAGIIWYGLHTKKAGEDETRPFKEKYDLDPASFVYSDAIKQMIEVQTKIQERVNLRQSQDQLKQNLQNFSKKLQEANYQVADFTEIVPLLNQIQNQLNQQTQNQHHLQDLNLQEKQLQDEINTHQSQLNDLYLKNSVKSLAEFKALASQAHQQDQLKLQLKTLKNGMSDNLMQLEQIAPDKEKFVQKLNQVETEFDQKQNKFNGLQEQIAQVKAEMAQLANSNNLLDEKQIMANLKSQLRENSVQYLANLAAARWISTSLDLASNGRFPKMIASAKEYFKLLTGGRYLDLEIGKKIKVISKNKRKYEVQYLSRGTSEQLYFALKLAFVEQVSDKISLPILIDDAFVNFDEQRTKYIVQLLEKLSQKAQVLIFTQKTELAELLNLEPLKLATEEV